MDLRIINFVVKALRCACNSLCCLHISARPPTFSALVDGDDSWDKTGRASSCPCILGPCLWTTFRQLLRPTIWKRLHPLTCVQRVISRCIGIHGARAAFARAQSENKPILLDIGAVWCHWCHVMDRESYEDPEIARIINEHFIAIKVDRDERPDVDTRYQAAVSAISQQGGWPLTAFLTPDGRPYFGGTYFPRDDRYGRPGFGRVLLTMAQVWRERRDEALESAASVMSAIEHNESFSARGGDLNLGAGRQDRCVCDRAVRSCEMVASDRSRSFLIPQFWICCLRWRCSVAMQRRRRLSL